MNAYLNLDCKFEMLEFFLFLILTEIMVPKAPNTSSMVDYSVSAGMLRMNKLESKHFFMFC